MRKNVLPITAGVLGSLALAVSASADFTGWQLELKGSYDTALAFGGPNVGLVDVWNLYLLFDDPNDVLTGIFVLADSPNFGEMIHSSDLNEAFDGLGGGFWNWASGANTPLSNGPTYNLDPTSPSVSNPVPSPTGAMGRFSHQAVKQSSMTAESSTEAVS